MTIEQIKTKLEEMLTPKRFIHSLNVMNTAAALAGKYGQDNEKAAIAGLLHDCARDIMSDDAIRLCKKYGIPLDEIYYIQPELLHGPVGAGIAAEKFGISDNLVLNAITYHTTGRENMGMLEKIIFIADYIEPGRNFPGVEKARELAYNNINNAVLFSLDKTVTHVIAKGALIHPDTISARNYILKTRAVNIKKDY